MASGFRRDFEASGFAGPIPIFDKRECRRILRLFRNAPPPIDWFKGGAPTSRRLYQIATDDAILDRVAELLGDDIMLWGASLVDREPDQVHPWHTDIESSGERGRTATVWIGLSNTNPDSSLQLITRSHRFKQTLQERTHEAGIDRSEVTTQEVLQWAQQHDPESNLVRLAMSDGEAVFFDGRLWHGSHNTNRWWIRTALLLQYATPDTPIRIPDFSQLDWPFRFLETPTPPCIMVRGSSDHSANNMVSPPLSNRGHQPVLSSRIKTFDLPLADDPETGWNPHPFFRGQTECMADLSCHTSVLSPETTPHEPHRHAEEELLIMLSGEAELVIVDRDASEPRQRRLLQPGAFVYYPAQQCHTIHNAGSEPATYLMFKWNGKPPEEQVEAERAPLQTSIFQFGEPLSALASKEADGFVTERVFEGPTQYLRKLHGHVSTLSPGAGYPPHVDAYDVAILLLHGTVKTLGQRVDAPGVIFYSAGEPHGIKNIGDAWASYLVFEFHGSRDGPAPRTVKRQVRRALRKVKPVAKRILPQPMEQLIKKSLSYVRRTVRRTFSADGIRATEA